MATTDKRRTKNPSRSAAQRRGAKSAGASRSRQSRGFKR